MELCDVATNGNYLVGATRALFILKSAARRVDASVTWARVSASVLSGSKNPAIAAEARRLRDGLYDLRRPYDAAEPDLSQSGQVVRFSSHQG